MASGTSAAMVSRIGLPLSQVSAVARSSRFSSMRSAILLRMRARSVGLALAPGVFRRMGRVERSLDIVFVGARDLADFLAGDRRDIVEGAAGFRVGPFAVYEIAVARLEGRFPRGEGFVLGHGGFLVGLSALLQTEFAGVKKAAVFV